MKDAPENRCQVCKNLNPTWHAPSELWNRVMGSPDGIVCPRCFQEAAERQGITVHCTVEEAKPAPFKSRADLVLEIRRLDVDLAELRNQKKWDERVRVMRRRADLEQMLMQMKAGTYVYPEDDIDDGILWAMKHDPPRKAENDQHDP